MKTCLAWVALAVALGPLSSRAQSSAVPEGPRFDIVRYVVEGNTLLPAASIDRALAAFTGQKKAFATIQQALAALTKAYAVAGYSAVQVSIPEQEIRNGDVRFQVRELKLGQVVVEGNTHFGGDNIRRSLPALIPGASPNVDHVARNLLTANENASKQTQVVLRAGEADGTVDAVAKVRDQNPLRFGVGIDTTGTPSTGILRASVAAQHSNMFDRDQALSAQYITSTEYPSRVSIVGLGYRIPLYQLGDSVEFAYVYSDVNSGSVNTSAGKFGISGSGNFYTARYNFNLPRTTEFDQRFIFGADWREYRNDVRFAGAAGSLVPDITVHPLSVAWSGRWRDRDQDLSGFLSAYHNIAGGSDGDQAAFNKPGARPGAATNYTLYRFAASYTRQLPRDFQVRVGANAQMTNDMLVNGEQFGVGGMDSVRGFTEREVASDRGMRTSLEGYSPDFGTRLRPGVSARALVFFDYGQVKRNGALPGEKPSEAISSAGVGLRLFYGTNMSLRLDYGTVLQPGGVQGRGDQRLQGAFSWLF